MKRIITVFAALLLIFTAIPITVNAAEEKMNVIYVSNIGNDGYDGKSYSMAVKTLTRAIRLCYDGGTIVVCGAIKSNSSFQAPKTVGHITITSVYGGVDYADIYGAKLSLGATRFILDGEYTFRDIRIEATANAAILCRGGRVIFDKGITCSASKGVNLPSITGGDMSNYQSGGARITVNSGDWYRLRGGNHSVGGSKNGTYIEINGGTFSSVVQVGGESDSYGDAYLVVNGGALNGGLRVVGDADLHGNAFVAINGGTVKTVKLSEGGKIHGKAEFYINSDTGTCNISKQYVTEGATLVMATKLPVSGSCEKITDAAQAIAGVKKTKDAISAEFESIEKAREDRLNEWFGAFDIAKTGTASLGIREENNSVELLSAKIEVEDNKPSYIGIIAIALAVIAIAGAFVLWR
ncbi:MAG: hypothetical protein IJF74_02895, partial [Clostridia bacterium]|nr:hypothetical protein [Clostridia bacterium]